MALCASGKSFPPTMLEVNGKPPSLRKSKTTWMVAVVAWARSSGTSQGQSSARLDAMESSDSGRQAIAESGGCCLLSRAKVIATKGRLPCEAVRLSIPQSLASVFVGQMVVGTKAMQLN